MKKIKKLLLKTVYPLISLLSLTWLVTTLFAMIFPLVDSIFKFNAARSWGHKVSFVWLGCGISIAIITNLYDKLKKKGLYND